jgi:hypothetical protein
MKDFKETQHIRFWGIWVALGLLNLLFGFIFVYQVILGYPFGKIPLPNSFVIPLFLVMALALIGCIIIHLTVRIDEQGVHYRFFPLQRKFTTITWYNISDACVLEYEPIYEYGGWGKKGTPQKQMLSISGKMGLQLVLRNGHRLTLGTRRPVEVKAIAQYYFRP